MPGPPTCQPVQSGSGAPRGNRSPASCRGACSNTLSSTDFTRRRRRDAAPATRCRVRRQAGCMARTDTRRKTQRLPADISRASAAAEDKKAIDVVILDLRKASGFTDYFLICSGQNARQIRAIADAVMETLGSRGAKPSHVEGYKESEWVLLDCFDFVVHIFAPD